MVHIEKGLRYMNAKSKDDIEEFAKQNGRPITNKVSFTFQDGAVKEAGINGVQAHDILHFLYGMFASLNGDFPCVQNLHTLDALEHAMKAQRNRCTDRITRGVEGTDNA